MRRTAPSSHAPRRDADESGFTVVEVVMAIVLVTIVMTSVAAFFVTSGRATEAQSLKQTAVQVATDAINKARSMSSVGLTAGRDQSSSNALWSSGQNTTAATKFPGVGAYLGTTASPRLTMAYDTTSGLATNAGYNAALPTNGKTVTIDGMAFTENWFLGYCLPNGSGLCTPGTSNTATSYTEVVVDVTWTNAACANSLCSYVTSTLVSGGTDPTFDASTSASRPQVANPGNQTTAYKGTVSLGINESSGTAPFSWSAVHLPPGLTLNASSTNSTTVTGKPTGAGTFNTRITVTDSFGFTSTAGFSWTTAGPVVADIADQSATVGTAKSVSTSISGSGTSPYRWSATGLPTGMSIGSGTGTTNTISGTPTQSGVFSVQVTMVDGFGFSDTEPFTLTVTPTISNTSTSCPTTKTGNQYTCTGTFKVTGSNPAYAWTDNVTGGDPTPTGDSSTATITLGRSTAGNFSYTIYATDADGVKASLTVTWKFGP